MSKVIKKPLLTEKNNNLAIQNTYVFEVVRSANKTDIKEHIERYFDVKVHSIRTAICRNRAKKGNRRTSSSKVKYWKKAIVRLKKGEKMSLFEGN